MYIKGVCEMEVVLNAHRKAKVKSRAQTVPTDAELEARLSTLNMPEELKEDFSCQDIIKANFGKTIEPIEKWQ